MPKTTNSNQPSNNKKAPNTFSDLNSIAFTGLLRRLAAIIYDSMLIMAIFMLVGFIGVSLQGGEANESPVFRAILGLVIPAFYAYFWRKSGQTLGMMAWRIRVQTHTGQPINFKQTLLRLLGGALSWSCLGLGFVWLKFDAQERSWPDLLSNTQTVLVPKMRRL